ncbi:SelT/SelW/SelH family protein [Aspergillus ruber CBS 135680]|uniref:Rdx family-domain-containing protein n=1 Tax=Aspergillus ruber (strain CBS 135680) TaxID=1388766 RepID=A0A017S3U3_ASPRC|nr:uncharacterized protein EURHEDRAFT_416377 [Aspergillus ruber CBS 135680]EYE91501.1 hypothetical protein EURHEDRAFT_416377 [Aspergillus ruber CBS 135680]
MAEPMPPIEQRTPTEQHQKLGSDNITAERVYLPRITIKYCTQCKWMLRSAYFAQELLSTFNTDLGEVALIPSTGGVFTVTMYHASDETLTTSETVLWDRKTNGGFPEVKQLKALVRNIVDPSRSLGHTDRALRAANVPTQTQAEAGADGKRGSVSGLSQDMESATANVHRKEKERCEECQ